jgi:phage shock protein E
MFQKLKKILGVNPSEDLGALIEAGTQIVDVRSKEEYASGHLKGSLNITLHDLNRNLGKIRKDKSVIVCCASGVRSSSAKNILELQGYKVYNGGGWMSLQRKIK